MEIHEPQVKKSDIIMCSAVAFIIAGLIYQGVHRIPEQTSAHMAACIIATH